MRGPAEAQCPFKKDSHAWPLYMNVYRLIRSAVISHSEHDNGSFRLAQHSMACLTSGSGMTSGFNVRHHQHEGHLRGCTLSTSSRSCRLAQDLMAYA